MKKIILTLAIAITTLGAFAGTEKTNVNSQVLNAFTEEFGAQKNVQWTVGTNCFKAAFLLNNQHVYAFYSTSGELLGMTKYMSSLDLPINLQSDLKKSYADFWISDLFEVSNVNGTGYYITVENADSKVVLESTNGSDWKVYQKARKA